MNAFVQRHAKDIIGVLSGFDRLRFRGTLRRLNYGEGLETCLSANGVRYKDFGQYAHGLSEQLRKRGEEIAKEEGRPVIYLNNSKASKEEVAATVAQKDGITIGLVCVLKCVEPCWTYSIRRDERMRLGFVGEQRKCLHLYFYYMDREFGLMHVRLATWLPFTMEVCLNGREYLGRRMKAAGIGYEQRDNCFVRIDDLPRAQAMMDALVDRKWERFLSAFARRINPLPKRLGIPGGYYWTICESEYALDVMFRDSAALARVYPALVEHAMRRFSCGNVMRFLGRRTCATCFDGEVWGSLLERIEGIRVKHWVEENSIKMYDKQGSVLRIETTINNPRRFRVRRMTVRKGVRGMRWIPMRYGLADLVRRVEISRAANERYLEALADVDVPSPARELLDMVGRRMVKDNRPYRALRPASREEAAVFKAVMCGQFLIRGFTNRAVRQCLGLVEPTEADEARRQAGRITRMLRLLRAHGLIRKVSGTRYYRVTRHGQRVMTAALRVREADVTKLVA